jgi:ribosomal-protein-alanine N-acetyltransferase
MAEFRVRYAAADDVRGIVALDRATELLPHWTESEYAAAAGASSAGGSVRRCLFVAEIAGELVGFAVGMAALAGDAMGVVYSAELESVAVARSARRMGVAKALCNEVIGWARHLGAKEMDLEVRSGSAGAIRLYEALRFVSVGRRARYYKGPAEDAVLMRLRLEPLPAGPAPARLGR